MALQLWMGNAGSEKSNKLYQHVVDEAQKHPELTYLVIVPEQFTLQTQHDFVMLHPKHGIMNIDILSFARLAHRVFEEVGFASAAGILIDDMGKSLILRHLAGRCEERLKVLGRNLKKLGYINEVKSVISEFMQYGIGSAEIEQLQNAAQSAMLSQKLEDIQVLYNEFRTYIDEKYTTSEELLERVSAVLPESEKIKKSVVVFDGFTGFTPVQYKVLAALLQNSMDVYVTILLDVNSSFSTRQITGEQELFYLSKKTVRELTRLTETLQIEKKADYLLADEASLSAHPALGHLEKNLFREESKPYKNDETDKITNEIQIFTAAFPEEEMRCTAIKIQELIQQKGYRYQDIAIITGDIDTYMHVAERVFTKYGIPYFVDKTQPILLNPLIEYIRAVVSILADDYSYEGMFRYLKSSLTDFKRADIDRLENYVLACGIRGSKQWKQHFVRKTASMETEELQELDLLREKITHDFEAFDILIAAYNSKNKRQVKSQINKKTNNSKQLHITVCDYAQALYQFIVQGHMQERLKVYEEHFIEAGNSAKAKEYAQVYRQVMDLLDKLVELLGDEEMSVKEFGELLDAGFDEIRIGVIPAGTDYVQVGDITRSRLRKIKALFFVGVNDGIIPMSNSGGGIISDMDREFLMEAVDGIELAPSARMQAYTQRLYLYMLMTKPEERLYLSFARLSEDGKSLRPSYLIQTILRMFPQLTIEKADETGLFSRIWNENAGFMELVKGMQGYIAGQESLSGTEAEHYQQLFQCYALNSAYADKLKNLVDTAFSIGVLQGQDHISRAVAEVLYGKVLTSSVTRLESYSRCAYQHFLTYGLGLKERELFSFEANDMGLVFHDALQTYAELLSESGYTWFSIPPEKTGQLVETAVLQCVASGDYAALYSSFRTTYMVERMKRITARTVEVLTNQIKKGSFIPKKFELAFSAENDYHSLNVKLSEDESLHLRGRIDRMDIYEDTSQVYVKIIDYKSGNQAFDLAAVYQGLQLQLVVYLNAAMEMQEKANPEKQIMPAGILYYHIDDPLVEANKQDTPEDINKRIISQLTMKGLVNSDETVIRLMDQEFEKSSDVIPVSRLKSGELSSKSSVASTEEFQIISDYVNYKIKEMGTEILSGNIQARPQDCTYCNYRTVCHYTAESENDTDEAEEAMISRLGKEELIAKMKEAVEQGGEQS